MRALITGAGGFVGTHLTSELLESGYEVAGFDLHGAVTGATDPIDRHVGDIRDHEAVGACFAATRPDVVFHLAGAASVGASFADPQATFAVNVGGTLNVLEAVRLADWGPRLVCVTSAEVYGAVPVERLPVDELTPLAPHSPYGASKAAADIAALQYHRGFGIDVITVRPFNHIGPGQDRRFVVPSIACQIALQERTDAERAVVRVGNVAARRDFLDVRDVVRAYRLLAERGLAGRPYVVGKGRSESVGELIDLLTSCATKPVDVVAEAGLMRPGEPEDLYCSPARLADDTGWAPRHSLPQTLADTLDWWRSVVEREDI